MWLRHEINIFNEMKGDTNKNIFPGQTISACFTVYKNVREVMETAPTQVGISEEQFELIDRVFVYLQDLPTY